MILVPSFVLATFVASFPPALTPGAPDSRKEASLKEADRQVRNSTAPLLGQKFIPTLRDKIARLRANAKPMTLFDLKSELADAMLWEGDVTGAIAELQGCQQILDELGAAAELKGSVWTSLAVANMRRAERGNCVAHHNSESCILPISAAAVHTDRAGAEATVECLQHALELNPDDQAAIWLLNVAHMTLGSYPDRVAPGFLIPPSAFASEHDLPRFHDVAAKLGVNAFSLAGGSSMDDFDNDGLLDILVSSMNPSLALKLFHNNGDGSFTDIAVQVGLAGQLGGLNFIDGDIDNDGRIDVLVLRGGWMGRDGEFPNSLLKQDGNGVFQDVTRAAGVEQSAPTQTAAFADFDNDGDLDLFVGYESTRDMNGVHYQSRMYQNRGDGTFADVTSKALVTNNAMCKGVSVGDYDDDRLPDIYVSNFGSANRLYHNNGDGTFTDVAKQLGVEEPIWGFPTWFFDYDNDGHLDILASCYGESASFGGVSERGRQMTEYYKAHVIPPMTARLYHNDGHGAFRDVTQSAALNRVFFPMGSNFGDIDNDGYQDMYFGTGDPSFASLWPNIMLRNDRGQRFQDVTTAGGFGHLQKGHGVAFGDLDNDGDQDMFVELGGAYYDDAFWDAMFENPGNTNHWITVLLKGVQSNRFGVGARIRVRIAENGTERDVFAYGGTGGSFGNNSLQQEIGLGQATRIVKLEVFWPTSNTTQSFDHVAMDQFIEVEEGAAEPRVLVRRKIKL